MPSIYEDVTAKIVEQLERGVAPWRKPWTGGNIQMPCNAVSSRPYSGINVWLLWLASEANGWSSGRWATYRAWNRIGGHVNRGERGTKVTYWNVSDEKTADPNTDRKQTEKRFFLRTYTVFALGAMRRRVPRTTLHAAIDQAVHRLRASRKGDCSDRSRYPIWRRASVLRPGFRLHQTSAQGQLRY